MGDDIPDNEVAQLYVPHPKQTNMNNKELKQGIIKWHEEYKFLRNVVGLYIRNKKDIWLGIQVVEMPEVQPGEDENTKKDFQVIGWNFIKVNRPNGSIRAGLYNVELYEPPVKKPPYDPGQCKVLPITADVYIDEY